MLCSCCSTGQPGSTGFLTDALNRFRLPSCSGIVWQLNRLVYRANVAGLWASIFGESGHFDDGADVTLIHRVNMQLFPVDEMSIELEYMCNADEIPAMYPSPQDNLLELPLPYDSFGVLWEDMSLSDLDDWAQQLAAISVPIFAEYDDDALDEVETWYLQNGLEMPANLCPPEHTALRAALACQQPPLDGLAIAFDCVLKNTGNLFLDDPSLANGREEYLGQYSEFFWTEDDIRYLAAEFGQVRPQVDRLIAYINWYHTDPDARATVHALLCSLVDRPWHVEKGAGDSAARVVFDA